jgi:hypothetical protein
VRAENVVRRAYCSVPIVNERFKVIGCESALHSVLDVSGLADPHLAPQNRDWDATLYAAVAVVVDVIALADPRPWHAVDARRARLLLYSAGSLGVDEEVDDAPTTQFDGPDLPGRSRL